MATATRVADAAPSLSPHPGRLTTREHMITVLLSGWMTVGIFVDGWAHISLGGLESFFTPWHALFYSGFAATAAWIGYLARRANPRGPFDAAVVPAGYLVGLFGVALFAVAGVADLVWHQIFGIEVSLDALLSPSHIALFGGGLLIGTSPLRALWRQPGPPESFAPILGSLTVTTAGIAFFFMYLSPFTELSATSSFAVWAAAAPEQLGYPELTWSLGVAQFMLTTVILLTPLLVCLIRWRLPFGSATLVFTAAAVGLLAMHEFEPWTPVLSAFVGGAASDLVLARLRPSAAHPAALCAAAALLPALLWSCHFAVVAVAYGIGWPAELWTGAIVMSSLTGLLIGFLLSVPRPAQTG